MTDKTTISTDEDVEASSDDVVDEMLVEEVSIDGLCGVY